MSGEEEIRPAPGTPEEGDGGFETGRQVGSDELAGSARGEIKSTATDSGDDPKDEPPSEDQGGGFETEINPGDANPEEGFETGQEIKGATEEKVTGFETESFELERRV
jgi:hypothetical protein